MITPYQHILVRDIIGEDFEELKKEKQDCYSALQRALIIKQNMIPTFNGNSSYCDLTIPYGELQIFLLFAKKIILKE